MRILTKVISITKRTSNTSHKHVQRAALVITFVFLFSAGNASVSASELVTNGSFETGTFAGWTTNITGTPFIPWLVSPAGAGSGFSLLPTQPQDGLFDAWNGFDGAGMTIFTTYQDIKIPQFLAAPAILNWKERLQWNFALTSTATQPRIYAVQLRDTNGVILTTLYSFSTGTNRVIGDSGWQSHGSDVSAYAGSTIRLWFQESIPESFTGPGQFELDAVSLNVVDLVSIDSCNTEILNRVIDPSTGGTLQQFVTSVVDACTASAQNHGDFVSCVTHSLKNATHVVITGREKGAITSCAAKTGRRGKY